MNQPASPKIDMAEHGANGVTSDRRLFMQFLAFSDRHDPHDVAQSMEQAGFTGAVYADLHDPRGVALAAMNENPAFFIDELRPWINRGPLKEARLHRELVMFGRTYALGYEPDLDEVLMDRPRKHVLDPDWPWAVWYPLRRKGEFARLDKQQQTEILREHAVLGMSFGRAGLARDIRLACHGLDMADNDFVIGLFGKELTPLSKLVETMRSTVQTSQYLARLGPFFVGKKIWASQL
ncbi:MAG: chlorite dismutase family protein [Phycisphaeraceae bacterium]|nr:chlorite dismutase family protein [Phycisphaeraceae bacterium]